jgi:2-amino-4-hydroxy-6-hydroxymethyldihydropteridine diphosphokinase
MQMAYIGMGANLPSAAGAPEATLAAAAARLAALGSVAARSHLYSTEPVGFAHQPRFVNAVAALETLLSPRELLDGLLAIEREFGRDRSAGILNGPRTLDLDILLYGERLIREAELEIPHPRLAERLFVLVPLNEIAPQLSDPRTGLTVAQLLLKIFLNSAGAENEIYAVESDDWRAGAADDLSGSN